MRTERFIWFKRLRIKNKIISIYFPLVLIPLLLMGLFSYTINSEAIIKKTKKNMLDESRLIMMRINTILNNADSFANLAMLDLNKDKQRMISQREKRAPLDSQANDDFVLRNQIENKLDFALMIFPDVESALFIDLNDNIYVTDPRLNQGTTLGLNSPMFQEVKRQNGINTWFPMQRRDYWVLNKEQAVLTIGKKILDTESLDTLGYLFVNVNEKALSSIYRPVGSEQSNGYYIIDDRELVISSSDENQILQPLNPDQKLNFPDQTTVLQEEKTVNGKKVLLTAANSFGKSGWKLVNEIGLKDLTKETRQVTKIIVIVCGVSLLFALLGAVILSKAIASPIVFLAKHMRRIREENIYNPVDVKSGDEIGILGSGLNMMLGRIDDLLVRVKEEQQSKREYELALIQDQIKPHFFYNTLDLIYVLCVAGENDNAGKATKALADFYRIALSNGKEMITVREEIRNLHSYLYIQSARYSDLFDFQILIPNELLNSDIPKLTLQPLVENAIYHGLKEKGSFGHLTIEGERHKDAIHLSVKDDGVGIPPERLEQWKVSGRESHFFGLNNVNERIKLYFGERYGIQIQSQLGKCTTVTVEIPLTNGDIEHD
ncbi:sensor histidine kinase [Paenibacillus segetis]|uniref:histidine kinase n=1 Tax=Paenibacillus segetis TaxID=1325360 RepID=A0ABQ1YAF3_9BACL|nr:sensor histidine kinase [Paenibacillus segetis]GGH18773.1 histidine kinase [Paenibacillus segetis]